MAESWHRVTVAKFPMLKGDDRNLPQPTSASLGRGFKSLGVMESVPIHRC
jgi:hypothetical protein